MQRIAAFSKGFYRVEQRWARVLISDLRMGQEPAYVFTFEVAEKYSVPTPLAIPEQVSARPDLQRGQPWLWRRALDEPLSPPS